MNIKVVKQDGTVQNYNPDKIIKVITAAGSEEKLARDIAEKVLAWIKKEKLSKVNSSDIRKRVYTELTKQDKYAAELYKWYKKTQGSKTS